MRRKPVIGEILIRYRPGKRETPPTISEVRVLKVGTKYFHVETVEGGYRFDGEFDRKDWGRKDTHNSRINDPLWLFESRDELEEYLRMNGLRAEVQAFFNGYGWRRALTDEQYLALYEIIQPKP